MSESSGGELSFSVVGPEASEHHNLLFQFFAETPPNIICLLHATESPSNEGSALAVRQSSRGEILRAIALCLYVANKM